MSRLSDAINIKMDETEWKRHLSSIQRQRKSVNPPWFKSMTRRNLQPIATAMRANSKSSRIAEMVGITTSKRRAGEWGAIVGVIRNDPSKFPTFSAPALASVIEFGTDERFRGKRTGIFITGRIPTGRVRPQPFLRPAWNTHVGRYMKNTEEDMLKKIEGSV